MRIAIIGGGASGTLCAIHLLRNANLKSEGRITIGLFESQRNQYLRGIAYSTLQECHLLNVPSDRMSLFSNQPLDFVEWLKGNSNQASYPFSSRLYFGRYLENRLTEQIQLSPHIKFESYIETVEDIKKKSNQWTVCSSNDQEFQADVIIFATGNLRPRQPQELSRTAASHPLYFSNSWQLDCDKWPKTSSVLFIGTGLSMLDGISQLVNSGHRGRYTAFSRKGLLPGVHAPLSAIEPSLAGLNEAQSLRAKVRLLRERIRDHESQGGDWQDVFGKLRNDASQIWQSLSEEDRRRFIRHLKSYWEVHRHRAPREQLQTIQDLRNEGRFSLLKGRLQAIEHDGTSFVATWKGKTELKRFDAVVNVTGPINDMRTHAYSPYQSLLAEGVIEADRLGLGLLVDENLNLIGSHGTQKNLFAIGSVTKGRFWEVTSIPDIRVQAEQITRQILT